MHPYRLRMYRRWWNMLDRCENPDNKEYRNYGGRGIKVCTRWRDFDLYLADISVLGRQPGPEYSIDRIDNDGHYRPGNVRWADPTQQRYNSRSHYGRKLVLVGTRTGRLTILAETDPVLSANRGRAKSTKHRAVRCRCDCGIEVTVKVSNLGRTTSCGCLRRERMRALGAERFGPGGVFHGSGNRARWGAAPD
jgi:hypothetical protein